jgi:hypothetical protein
MKFFIPHADTPELEEHLLQATKDFAQKTTGWTIGPRRIYSIRYRHDGRDYKATVGQPEPRTHEEVIAILDSNTYLVCTPNRGVLRGEPMLVGKDEVYASEDFTES